ALVVWCLIPIEPTLAAIRPGPETRFWKMAKGYQIAYTRIAAAPGAPVAPPIVFLHGGPGGYVHSSIVRTLAPLAARGHDLYFYEQVGSGRSDRLPRPKDYSFLGHVADLDEVVTRHLRAERVILIGQSYGGQLAAEYVALHPERVERMVLSSPGALEPALFDTEGRWANEAKYPVPAALRFVAPPDVAMDGLRFWPLRALASIAVATLFDVKLMPDAEADGVLDTLASGFTRGMVCDPARVQPEEGGAGFYAHGWGNWYEGLEDPRPLLRRRELPVLVVQGACDYLPYAGTYEYVDLFPNARYRFVAGAGHILWWERPEEYLGAIEEFLMEPRPGG
ncbi:MAG: alpha/beta hydrolase, partial [Thermoanaerobaculia bacterium]|nr:alpha/beta hydrolase [Thermoanaerobaculia bacterium]